MLKFCSQKRYPCRKPKKEITTDNNEDGNNVKPVIEIKHTTVRPYSAKLAVIIVASKDVN